MTSKDDEIDEVVGLRMGAIVNIDILAICRVHQLVAALDMTGAVGQGL